MMENPLEVIGTIMGFALSIQTSTARPSYNWSIAEDGTLSLWTSQKPLAVNLWYANTIDGPARRDFRLVVSDRSSLYFSFSSLLIEPLIHA